MKVLSYQEDNKAFHQAKTSISEQVEIIEGLMRIYKLGQWTNSDGNEILHKLPTRLDLRVTINDLTDSVTKQIAITNIYDS